MGQEGAFPPENTRFVRKWFWIFEARERVAREYGLPDNALGGERFMEPQKGDLHYVRLEATHHSPAV